MVDLNGGFFKIPEWGLDNGGPHLAVCVGVDLGFNLLASVREDGICGKVIPSASLVEFNTEVFHEFTIRACELNSQLHVVVQEEFVL